MVTSQMPERATGRLTPAEARDPLEQYDLVKSAIQQTFIDLGATLSRHHPVATEHARWLEEDLGARRAARPVRPRLG
jgi:hypothetical protein